MTEEYKLGDLVKINPETRQIVTKASWERFGHLVYEIKKIEIGGLVIVSDLNNTLGCKLIIESSLLLPFQKMSQNILDLEELI